ncbi:MAG TPA: helix-turn-helix domain-containing protein [Jatrophihabitans sp.]|uniref:winged helix-turn-helix transcriptional regulator n=1 Tax=Jatrophihabitans sp. TaxID=1932789 RepID=UPI002E0070C9|nr:helix-turn-helix domain-containing protein [Jatrophihabitans sp.]
MTTKHDRAGNVLDVNCPSRLVLDRIAEKWTGLVVLVLGDGTLRFGELRERVGGVAPKVLTQTLRGLERDGLLTRTVYAEVPPRVEYTLTDLGRSLREPLAVVQAWAENNVSKVMAARERHGG